MKKAALICVTRNNAEKLQKTLNSIIQNTNPEHYDLIIIDNASSDLTLGIYQVPVLADNITIVRSGKNLHWVGGINLGIEMTKGYQYVGFLNDDIEVCPNWLENFFDVLDCNPDVAAVGPLTSNSRDWQGYDNVRLKFKHWGLPVHLDLDRQNILEMSRCAQSNGSGVKISKPLEFFCVLFRREALDKVGQLNIDFTELYFGENEEYCARLSSIGYSLAISFKTYIKHESGFSSLKIPAIDGRRLRASEIISQTKFGKKNKGCNLNTGFFGIDKIWLINLERRPDRLEKFKKNNPIIADRVEILKAVDGKELMLTPSIARLFASNNFEWNKPKMGCCLSHLKIWLKLLEEIEDDTTFLILEDDAILLDDWYQTLMNAFYGEEIPVDWDVLYLGGTRSCGEDPGWHEAFIPLLEKMKGNIYRMGKNNFYGQKPSNRLVHFTTISYLINKKGVQRTLNLLRRGNGFWQPVDNALCHRMPENDEYDRNIYFFWPHIASYYQVDSSIYAKTYTNEKTEGISDSDIWQNNDVFDEKLARKMYEDRREIDFELAAEMTNHNASVVSHL